CSFWFSAFIWSSSRRAFRAPLPPTPTPMAPASSRRSALRQPAPAATRYIVPRRDAVGAAARIAAVAVAALLVGALTGGEQPAAYRAPIDAPGITDYAAPVAGPDSALEALVFFD